ncbi:hypothetical protein ACGFNU_33175 [Spirillospora sp. NPDC048911]|uniref:hypothetical protein n=1 Tax=Spirillospora sp. NPDC048911 TaxID=3364527 RepID=UPI0037102AD9
MNSRTSRVLPRLIVAAAVVGHGNRVFEGDTLQKWTLRGLEQGKNGTLFLDYSHTP